MDKLINGWLANETFHWGISQSDRFGDLRWKFRSWFPIPLGAEKSGARNWGAHIHMNSSSIIWGCPSIGTPLRLDGWTKLKNVENPEKSGWWLGVPPWLRKPPYEWFQFGHAILRIQVGRPDLDLGMRCIVAWAPSSTPQSFWLEPKMNTCNTKLGFLAGVLYQQNTTRTLINYD